MLDILNNTGILILIGIITFGFIFGKVLEHSKSLSK
jgi:hypothetical protein